jgi:glucose-1-phosphate thymidylyltransferase
MSHPKAIILAAGYGTRLGKAGEQLPKGLIEFNHTNLISHVVTELHSNHVTAIAVVTNAKYYDQYHRWADSQPPGITLINDHTTSPANRLGALGDLRFAIDQLGWQKQNILVAPSDTYFTFPLASFLATITQSPADFAAIVKIMPPEVIKNRFACAALSPDHQILECVEKPEVPLWPYAVLPFYYYPAEIHPLIAKYQAEGNSPDAPGSIIPWFLKNTVRVNACLVADEALDIGTPTELDLLKKISS